ncbi:MAG: sensor domain-containing protein [Mycobacterium sp.]
MSEGPQGDGWWQASDHKWYPPERHPDYVAPLPPPPPPAPEPAAQQSAAPDLSANQQVPPPPAMAPTTASSGQRQGRAGLIAAIAAVVVVLVVGAGAAGYFLRQSSTTAQPSTTAVTPTTVPPVVEAALDGLLLTPDDINTVMDVTGMHVSANRTAMNEPPYQVSDKACLFVGIPAADPVYAGSGWTAVRGRADSNPGPGQGVDQNVVLFTSAQDAAAFFTASAQSWSACSNRRLAVSVPGRQGEGSLNMGTVSNTNSILSAPVEEVSIPNAQDQSFEVLTQRALALANNVIIDVWVGGLQQHSAEMAVTIAKQIAAKVPTT